MNDKKSKNKKFRCPGERNYSPKTMKEKEGERMKDDELKRRMRTIPWISVST